MKKNIKYIVAVVIVVLMFVVVYVLYSYLSTRHTVTVTDTSQEVTTSEESTEPVAATDFTVTDQAGNQVTLSDCFGKPIILNFWATWCDPCQSELQAFDDLYAEYGDEVQFMMINLTDGTRDTVDGVNAYVEENGYTFPVYFDTQGSAAGSYGIYSIPMTVVIDSEGNVVNRYIGAMEAETIEAYIKGVLE